MYLLSDYSEYFTVNYITYNFSLRIT